MYACKNCLAICKCAILKDETQKKSNIYLLQSKLIYVLDRLLHFEMLIYQGLLSYHQQINNRKRDLRDIEISVFSVWNESFRLRSGKRNIQNDSRKSSLSNVLPSSLNVSSFFRNLFIFLYCLKLSFSLHNFIVDSLRISIFYGPKWYSSEVSVYMHTRSQTFFQGADITVMMMIKMLRDLVTADC